MTDRSHLDQSSEQNAACIPPAMRTSVYGANTPKLYMAFIGLGLLFTAISLFCGFRWLPNPKSHMLAKSIIYCVWTLGPPVWFFCEFFYFRQHGQPDRFEIFKYGQELAAKIWLALAVVLGALFFGKDIVK